MSESLFTAEQIADMDARLAAATKEDPKPEPTPEPADTAGSAARTARSATPTSSGKGPKTTTTQEPTAFDEAAERAAQFETLVSDARKQADADIRAKKLALESASPGDTAIAEGRFEGAKAKGEERIRAAEAKVTTPLAGAGKITVPRLTEPGEEIEPGNVLRSAARIAAKQAQVEADKAKADKNRKSKIRELADMRRQISPGLRDRPVPLSPEKKIRAEGLEQEIDELDLQIRNLDNLEKALESIRTKTLGSLPEDDPRFQKLLEEEKARLAGEPADFDPEVSRKAISRSPEIELLRRRKKLEEIAEGTRPVDFDARKEG